MHGGSTTPRDDALAIWRAALEASRSDQLVLDNVRVEGRWLLVGDEEIDLDPIRRVVVVGAGKAGAGMADGLERALGPKLAREKHLSGWINVPADCVRELESIHLHAARPAGVNEPREEGVAGTREILRLVSQATQDDLCVVLLSGGGSALLPAPIDGVSLADKQSVTRHLSAAGANIAELNRVRKRLSRVKGGGLWRACRAARIVTLVISDVLGDPLDIIASGPTVEDRSTDADALAVLEKYAAAGAVGANVFAALNGRRAMDHAPTAAASWHVIGNNALAVDAAGTEAVARGYSPVMLSATSLEGAAEDIGFELAERALAMRGRTDGPDCFIWGGEPVVRLADDSVRGLGGRNQQLILAAADRLWNEIEAGAGLSLVSGGTDGEDGPTDAAGAFVDAQIVAAAKRERLEPRDYLTRNDAYHFFERAGGLLKTGPTHTNVCDVRVAVVDTRVRAPHSGTSS